MDPHFRKVEKMYFLRMMEEVLPRGPVEWETVANRHNEKKALHMCNNIYTDY